MKIYYRRKGISVSARTCGFLGMIRGLMFRSKNTENLLFDNFSGGIHSWFVFFPFLAVFLDGKNKVVDIKVVKPFRLSIKSKKNFSKLIEIPINNSNKDTIGLLVGRGKV